MSSIIPYNHQHQATGVFEHCSSEIRATDGEINGAGGAGGGGGDGGAGGVVLHGGSGTGGDGSGTGGAGGSNTVRCAGGGTDGGEGWGLQLEDLGPSKGSGTRPLFLEGLAAGFLIFDFATAPSFCTTCIFLSLEAFTSS